MILPNGGLLSNEFTPKSSSRQSILETYGDLVILVIPQGDFSETPKIRGKFFTEAQWFLDFCKIHKAETPTLGPSSRPDRSERPERFGVDRDEDFIAFSRSGGG